MSEEIASRKSSVTIHLPTMSPTTTDLSLSDGNHTAQLSTVDSEPTQLHREITNQSDILNNDVIMCPEVVSENTECVLMTEKEIKEWDAKMIELVDRLKTQQEQHSTWENSLKSRQMAACDKLENLRRTREKRFEFYNRVEKHIKGDTFGRGSKTDEEKSELSNT